MSVFTCFCYLPQNEHFRRSRTDSPMPPASLSTRGGLCESGPLSSAVWIYPLRRRAATPRILAREDLVDYAYAFASSP